MPDRAVVPGYIRGDPPEVALIIDNASLSGATDLATIKKLLRLRQLLYDTTRRINYIVVEMDFHCDPIESAVDRR